MPEPRVKTLIIYGYRVSIPPEHIDVQEDGTLLLDLVPLISALTRMVRIGRYNIDFPVGGDEVEIMP